MAYKRTAIVRGAPEVCWVEPYPAPNPEDRGFTASLPGHSAIGFGTSIEEAVDDLGVRAGGAR